MRCFSSIATFVLEYVIANVTVTSVFLVQKENLPPLKTNSSFGLYAVPDYLHNTQNLSYNSIRGEIGEPKTTIFKL